MIPRIKLRFWLLILMAGFSNAHTRLLADDLTYSVSWIGNSYSGKDQHVQGAVDGICVSADGEVFTNSGWDEYGNEVQEYNPQGEFVRTAAHTHGWGYEGAYALAANSKYVFLAQEVSGGGKVGNLSYAPTGFQWLGVSRRKYSNVGSAPPSRVDTVAATMGISSRAPSWSCQRFHTESTPKSRDSGPRKRGST